MAGRWARPHATSLIVALIGVLVTAALTAAAWMSNESNEDQLLEERVREAAAVLDAAIPTIQTQLAVAARLADPEDFEAALDPPVTEGGSFVSASIWAANGTAPIAVVGESPALAEQPPDRVRDFLARSAAAAGHPLPLLLGASGSRFLQTAVGPPIGVVSGARYAAVETPLDDAATLLLFTDGLFERRGETVEDGMARLRRSAEGQTGSLQQLIDGVVEDLVGGAASDDAAVLGLRWAPDSSGTVADLDTERSERTDG